MLGVGSGRAVRGVLVLLALALVPFQAMWAALRPPVIALESVGKDGRPGPALPLEEISARVDVAGTLIRAELTQVFGNPFRETIEAVYSFPLPPDSAVTGMRMEIGSRVIRAVVEEKKQARAVYEQAKATGRTAALTEEQRPDVFTQYVAGIAPGERVRVVISYVARAERYDGGYRTALPTTIGERYFPGDRPAQGGADSVLALAGPSSGPGSPAPRLTLDLDVDGGMPVLGLTSSSHPLESAPVDPAGTHVRARLAGNHHRPDRDVRIAWKLAGDDAHATLLAHREGNDGHFMLHLEPPRAGATAVTAAQELFFVVDCSGSMSGSPMQASRAAIARCLQGARSGDTVQVVRFSDVATTFRPQPVPVTPDNVAAALAYVDALQIDGGTNIVEGVRASLSAPVDPERQRLVVFFTDGFIGNDNDVLAAIRGGLGAARVYTFGVGDSPNRYVLDAMARIGRGAADYVPLDSDPTKIVERFYAQLARPVVTDLQLEVEGGGVSGVQPAAIPDLLGERPVVLFGRYARPGPARFHLTGRSAGARWSRVLEVELPASEPAHEAVRTLWARERISGLLDEQSAGGKGEDARIVSQVTQLGLEFSLMTPYTSLVAVEERVVHEPGAPSRTVRVPVQVPNGVAAAPPSNAAPEPAEWALMLVAMATLTYLMRREGDTLTP